MLDRNELEKFASMLGFTIWQAERDYLQHLFLIFMSKKVSDELVFKGGTALQKAYGLNRFSIDLDFTEKRGLPADLFERIKGDFINFGFKADFSGEKNKNAFNIRFKVQGPLYKGTENTLVVLRVEISLREKPVLKPETREIFPAYTDLQPYVINVMPLEEMMAEKARAILTREKARDIFDLKFLLGKGVKMDKEMVKQKIKDYDASFSYKAFADALNKAEKSWQPEMGQLLAAPPEFKSVKKEILEKAKGWF